MDKELQLAVKSQFDIDWQNALNNGEEFFKALEKCQSRFNSKHKHRFRIILSYLKGYYGEDQKADMPPRIAIRLLTWRNRYEYQFRVFCHDLQSMARSRYSSKASEMFSAIKKEFAPKLAVAEDSQEVSFLVAQKKALFEQRGNDNALAEARLLKVEHWRIK